MRLALPCAALLLSFGCRRELRPSTSVLVPSVRGALVEPSLAIDPAHPERMIVGAMFGELQDIWIWQTGDGGRTWADEALERPHLQGQPKPTTAADVVVQFAVDGSRLIASMADSAPDPGGTYVSRWETERAARTVVEPFRNHRDSATGMTTLYDKPWMVVDYGEHSPYRGTVYITNGGMLMDPGPAGIGLPYNGPFRSRLMLSVSRDNGRTFSTPTLVADSAFGGNLAIGPAGSLEISYFHARTKQGGIDSILFRRSLDGGASITAPETIATMAGDTLAEMPVLAARPNGDLLDCWAQGVWPRHETNEVRCALRRSDGTWRRVGSIAFGAGVVPAAPAVAGSSRGWYLMVYLVSASRTEVAVFSSPDGVLFTKLAILASTGMVGSDQFCIGMADPCSRTGSFFPGHYVALARAGDRLAAAYVLPRSSNAGNASAAVYVTTLPEP